MASGSRPENTSVVALDHNYAQIHPIRVNKVQRDSHSTVPTLNPPRKARNKSLTSNVSDPGEAIEEDDLVEYYSQWCDKAFSSDGYDKVQNSFDVDSLRSRTSASISFECDSFESNNGDSNRSESLPPSDNTANSAREKTSNSLERVASISPQSSKQSTDGDECKMEPDLQVLAAASALLELAEFTAARRENFPPEAKKKRLEEDETESKVKVEQKWSPDLIESPSQEVFEQPSTSAFQPFKNFQVLALKLHMYYFLLKCTKVLPMVFSLTTYKRPCWRPTKMWLLDFRSSSSISRPNGEKRSGNTRSQLNLV